MVLLLRLATSCSFAASLALPTMEIPVLLVLDVLLNLLTQCGASCFAQNLRVYNMPL